MTGNNFPHKVKRMRELQKQYFKDRDRDTLIEAKGVEREVDAWLDEYGATFKSTIHQPFG